MMWWVGIVPFLLVHLPITILGGAIGIWLFYVQHQFEHTSWSAERDWSFPAAALYGSSHYDLPAGLRWFTANIGVHHVHHLCTRIPFIGCRLFFAGTPLWQASVESLCVRALHAYASRSGTKRRAASFRFVSCELGTNRRIGRYEGGHVHYSVIAVRS
jgi:fatty acid desaturase